MDLELPDHIVDLGTTARRAFADLGGVDLARAAEADPSRRASAGDAFRALSGSTAIRSRCRRRRAFVLAGKRDGSRFPTRSSRPVSCHAHVRARRPATLRRPRRSPRRPRSARWSRRLPARHRCNRRGTVVGSRWRRSRCGRAGGARRRGAVGAVGASTGSATFAWASRRPRCSLVAFVDLAVEHVLRTATFGQRRRLSSGAFQIADAVVAERPRRACSSRSGASPSAAAAARVTRWRCGPRRHVARVPIRTAATPPRVGRRRGIRRWCCRAAAGHAAHPRVVGPDLDVPPPRSATTVRLPLPTAEPSARLPFPAAWLALSASGEQ